MNFRFCRKVTLFGLLVISMAACIVPSALAQEGFAAYPHLPPSYSSIKVFDSKGQFVGRLLPEKRYWVSIDRIPAFLQKAVIAVEDSRFYEHNGIDVRGIARALVKDVVKGRMAEGGSTITQQLIKNKFLSSEKSIDRKLKEGVMAMDFEKKYTKKQILEMYFNEIYYGNGAWGIAQAARIYFDKSPQELTEAECSLLAGVPKNPGRYNPLGKAEEVSRRKAVVLKRMADLNMITTRQQQKLKAQRVAVTRAGQAPYYLAHIKGKLIEQFGPQVIEQGGLEVTAAMDLELQKLAEKTLHDGVKRISPQMEGALLCLDTNTGDVLAAVGGTDYKQSPYNRAFFAKRQPGSTIKPLIYAAALEKGIATSSIWSDTPVAYNRGNNEVWKPLNYGREQYGELSLRQALAYSNNVITVKLLDTVGVPYFVDFAGKVGLPMRAENGLSLALGSDEVTLNELVRAYSPFATGGLRPEPRTIIRIYDRNRRTWTENPPVITPVLSPATAYISTQMLKDVMTYGTAKGLKKFTQLYPAAGKTGTTDDYRDAWFVGYTPGIITGVWLGYDKPKPGGKGFTGGTVAAPIWERFMRQAVTSRPVADFQKPEMVVSVAIDPATGYLAAPDCPDKRDELYIPGTQPTEYCLQHGGESLNPVAMPPVQPEAPEGQPAPEGAQEPIQEEIKE
ncbi:membrane transglycosylase and transpeptidase PBP1A [Geotalea daltonii FRC-32]|uniref:Membrane transglycosylase and transpeptidase PBP1A n=1 Tax=Geotalea daltonii (strain DSM 22248 / JCM 15807 / FRC-32) TaxID=316067 RepID=B9M3R9_GEODF|nr:membrane transglycosylase and transpeptidase PBP1A [Geotalea daltonii FRC-32]